MGLRTRYHRPFGAVLEPGGGPDKVERAGYRTIAQMVAEQEAAGVRLRRYREQMYGYEFEGSPEGDITSMRRLADEMDALDAQRGLVDRMAAKRAALEAEKLAKPVVSEAPEVSKE